MPPKKAAPAPAPGDAALLPDKFEEFRSLSYWDGFFKKARLCPPSSVPRTATPPCRSFLTPALLALQRGAVPFEWYSEWAQLRPLLRAAVGADAPGGAAATPDVPAGGRVLVVGCGNSELSAQMYDDGFVDITNIDFSKARAPGTSVSPRMNAP